MKNQDSLLTKVTLANAGALVAEITKIVLQDNDDVDGNIGVSPLSTELTYQLAQSSFGISVGNALKEQ